MNRRIWLASTIVSLCFLSTQAEAAEPGITGKWASDSAVALKKWRDKRDEATPADRGVFSVDSGANGRGGRGGALGGRGGALGGRGGALGGGGGFGGRDFAQFGGGRGARGGALGGGGLGGGQLGAGGRGGPGGLNGVGAVAKIPPPELPDGPPVTMDLKVDKNKMTGTVVVSMDLDQDEKFKVEDGKVEGKTFTFSTYRKSSGMQIPTAWKGELRSDNVISLVRALPSGAAADDEPFAMRRQK